jgi:hypothetical protein
MKNKVKKFLPLAISSLLVVILLKFGLSGNFFSSPVNARVDTDQRIPSSLAPCIPKGIYNGLLDAKVKYGKGTYYSLVWERKVPSDIFEGEEGPVQELAVIVEGDLGCQVIVPPDKGPTHSKALFMPVELARQLALNAWSRRIALVGGREKFQKLLDNDRPEDAGTSPTLLFPEDKWALDRLGLRMPKGALILEIITYENAFPDRKKP